jgi:hypothetical protein
MSTPVVSNVLSAIVPSPLKSHPSKSFLTAALSSSLRSVSSVGSPPVTSSASAIFTQFAIVAYVLCKQATSVRNDQAGSGEKE